MSEQSPNPSDIAALHQRKALDAQEAQTAQAAAVAEGDPSGQLSEDPVVAENIVRSTEALRKASTDEEVRDALKLARTDLHRKSSDFQPEPFDPALGDKAEEIHGRLASLPTQGEKADAMAEGADRTAAINEIFSKVAAFAGTDGRKFAAGPDIRKATGLTQEAVMKLGFKNYDELEKVALGWKGEVDAAAETAAQEQEAAAAVAAEQAAKVASKAAYKQAGKEQADSWKAERDAHRADKAATESRIEEIMNGVAADEKNLSYKEKLERGGEFGLASSHRLNQKSREDAIAQAEAEGLPVDHLKPSEGLKLPTNTTAEARQAEYAQILRAHDRRALLGQNNEPKPLSDDPRVQDALDRIFADAQDKQHASHAVDSIQPTGLNEAGHQNNLAFYDLLNSWDAELNGSPAAADLLVSEPSAEQLDMTEEEFLAQPEVTIPFRVQSRLAKARAALRNFKDRTMANIHIGITGHIDDAIESARSDDPANRKALLMVAGGAAGVLALGAVYLQSKGFHLGFSGGHAANTTNEALVAMPPSGGNATNPDLVAKVANGAQKAHEQLHQFSLSSDGSSIESTLSHYAQAHGANPSAETMQHVAQGVLNGNKMPDGSVLNWESARHLPLDYHFNVTPEQLEELLKK